MSTVISFTVPGEPPTKERHRHFFNGKAFLASFYTQRPDRNRSTFVAFIRKYIRAHPSERNKSNTKLIRLSTPKRETLHDGPIMIKITAYMSIPSSDPQWKKEAKAEGYLRPIKKPDSDNIEKAIWDALSGHVWTDDSRIIDNRCILFYSDKPRTDVTIHLYREVASFKEWKQIKQAGSA